MFQKGAKFFADWRDRQGNRLRKSFSSQQAALKYEAEMKAEAHPKTAARGQRSPKFSVPRSRVTKQKHGPLMLVSPRNSSPQRAAKRRTD
jgi:hypothetical protein